jgi:hypothetical protein
MLRTCVEERLHDKRAGRRVIEYGKACPAQPCGAVVQIGRFPEVIREIPELVLSGVQRARIVRLKMQIAKPTGDCRDEE